MNCIEKQKNKQKDILNNLDYHLKMVKETYMQYNYPSCLNYNKVRKKDEPTYQTLAKALKLNPPCIYQQVLKKAKIDDKYIRLSRKDNKEKYHVKKNDYVVNVYTTRLKGII